MDLFDTTIIGAGPVGLFGSFYAGMRGMKTLLIDSLPEPGSTGKGTGVVTHTAEKVKQAFLFSCSETNWRAWHSRGFKLSSD